MMNAEVSTPPRPMLLVLGMHRSGTSALAGTLAALGVDFSDNLIPAAADNPLGFFEHADIWRRDQDILEALGAQWDDPLPLPADWQSSAAVQDAAPACRGILARDFGASTVAGIKDPRMCRLLPPWMGWLADAGFAAQHVLVLREPGEVMASLAKRDQLPADQVAWIWLRHTLEAEAATRRAPRVVVRYAALLADWRSEIARIASALGLTWPVAPDAAAGAIGAFLQPGLRHGRRASDAPPVAPRLQGWLDRVYRALDPGQPVDTLALDAVAAEIAAADALAAPAAAVLRASRLKAMDLDRTIQWCDGERLGLVAGNAELRENLERHAAELKEQQAGNAWLHAELERNAKRTSELVTTLGAREATLAAREATLAERDAELAGVYASRSWRLTRPLRYAVRLARRVLRGAPPAAVMPVALPAPASGPAPEPASASAPAPAPACVPPPTPTPTLTAASSVDRVFAAATGPRILIVTPDILGPIRNGGIGTAFAALAQTLAEAGHAVTILYTLGGHSEDGGDVARWTAHYAALGIRFVPAWLERGAPVLDAPHHAWRAYRVYLWLKAHQADYDLAYFPEWKGEAYYALQTKRLGLDFARLRFVVVTHSSTTWADSGNFVLPEKFDDLLLEFLERRVVELADAVVSPSQYMLDWMHGRGWTWSAKARVIQNLMADGGAAPPSASPAPITEWVFFGRLERRKGLLIFLEALRQVPAELRARIQVTFLGKAIATTQFDSMATIRGRLDGWTHAPRFLVDCDRDQALAYLAGPGRVAVIASLVENSPYTVLECLLRQIPFIAADVGGIAELVHADDRARSLFRPTPAALAQTLMALDAGQAAPPRPAHPAAETRQRWLALQDELMAEIPEAPPEPQAPLPSISVCLVHYDRPGLLARALDSLRAQTYATFDVVLVDDGSPSAAAQEYLDSLGPEFARRGWTLLRQANAYLGAARNAAARAARGDYLLFMDDDNLAKPEELAVFAAAARASGADILTTVSDVFSAADEAALPPEESTQLWIPLGNAQGLGVFRNVFGDANALFRRSTFAALGGFTEDYGIGHEDWELFARASLAGARIELVPQPLFWYRVNAHSMLRAGDTATDHARSVRPYWERLPRGIGPALAYAAHLHHRPVRGADAQPVAASPGLWRVLTGVFHASDRARLRELLRDSGARATLTRGVRRIGRALGRR